MGPLAPPPGAARARPAAAVRLPSPGALANRRGSSLPILLVCLTMALAMGAVAVDVGMIYTARAEAQRAADAAALAGASAFAEPTPPRVVADTARARAIAYAAMNPIQRTAVRPEEVQVQVIPDSAKVRVWVRRGSVGTWFARAFGVDSALVGARAAAWALPAPRTDCVKPFAPPDMWHDADDDLNRNRLQDGLEIWKFETKTGDYFLPFTGNPSARPAETGYWSTYRGPDRDFGRRIAIKITDADLVQIPGLYYLWHMNPADNGAGSLRDWIRYCFTGTYDLDDQHKLLGGDRLGPVAQGVRDLVVQDPSAYWDDRLERVVGSRFTPWWTSPRVVKVPFYDPRTLTKGKNVKFSHFSWVFIEGQATDSDPVMARYMNLVRLIKLVE